MTVIAEYNLGGYDLLPLNMEKEDPGRGMLIYIQSGVKYSPVNMKSNFCESYRLKSLWTKVNKCMRIGKSYIDLFAYKVKENDKCMEFTSAEKDIELL